MEDKKNLEVISDNGSSLDISPVYDHLNISTPKSADERPKNIVIPKAKSKRDDDKNNKDKSEKKEEEN